MPLKLALPQNWFVHELLTDFSVYKHYWKMKLTLFSPFMNFSSKQIGTPV